MREKKRILMLTTGGTIASTVTDRGLAPALHGDELLKGLEDLRESAGWMFWRYAAWTAPT